MQPAGSAQILRVAQDDNPFRFPLTVNIRKSTAIVSCSFHLQPPSYNLELSAQHNVNRFRVSDMLLH